MSTFTTVTPSFSVAPQIGVADFATAAGEGFSRVINNRPDGESPDQPPNSAMEAAAKAVGLDYHWIPVTGAPTPQQADAVVSAMSDGGKTLAFCRSGTRSITAWAIGQARSGSLPVGDLIQLGDKAGYDLSWLRGALR